MLSWLGLQWSKRPLVVLGVAFLIALSIDSIAAVWGERRPVGGFFEEFIARALIWGISFGSIAAGVWGGVKVHERTNSTISGWIVGLIMAVLIGIAATVLTSKIPGVNWRIDRYFADSY
jgi:hypothetical protein